MGASVCADIVGINCSYFVVDNHHFAAQAPSERKLWLRALSNVKVKIQNNAPEPTEEEMAHYRESIREQIHNMRATSDPRISSDALLSRRVRKMQNGEAESATARQFNLDGLMAAELVHLRQV